MEELRVSGLLTDEGDIRRKQSRFCPPLPTKCPSRPHVYLTRKLVADARTASSTSEDLVIMTGKKAQVEAHDIG